MNAQRIARETATSHVRASRETREMIPNPYDRVVYAGAQSDRFQILRRVPQLHGPGSYFIHFGSYASLDEAIRARDRYSEDMPPRPHFDGNTFRGIRD